MISMTESSHGGPQTFGLLYFMISLATVIYWLLLLQLKQRFQHLNLTQESMKWNVSLFNYYELSSITRPAFCLLN
jgi:hypothetical protein